MGTPAGKPKFYAVWKGRRRGVFSSWEECATQVRGFPGAQFKSFASQRAAEQALRGDYSAHAGTPASGRDWLFAPLPPRQGSLAVDAACSGATGRMEYRGVDLDSLKQIFHAGPFENGTNNIGEFLAIVHALEILSARGSAAPIYSDSATAIAWVKAKRCKTRHARDETNASLFTRIEQAEKWLAKHPVENPILKWDTHAWGENPADFNRK